MGFHLVQTHTQLEYLFYALNGPRVVYSQRKLSVLEETVFSRKTGSFVHMWQHLERCRGGNEER